jgi:hypothetical protein
MMNWWMDEKKPDMAIRGMWPIPEDAVNYLQQILVSRSDCK